MTLALDTHAIVRKPKSVGFSEEQAEAVTDLVRDAQDSSLAGLATKADLQALKVDIQALKVDIEFLRKDTKADNDGLRKDMRADIQSIKSELVLWMFGAVGFQLIAMIGGAFALAPIMKP